MRRADFILGTVCVIVTALPAILLMPAVTADEPCITYAKYLTCTKYQPVECEDYNQQVCQADPPPSNSKLYPNKWDCFTDIFGNTWCLPVLDGEGAAVTAVCRRQYRCQWDPLMGGSCKATSTVTMINREPIYKTVSCETGLEIPDEVIVVP